MGLSGVTREARLRSVHWHWQHGLRTCSLLYTWAQVDKQDVCQTTAYFGAFVFGSDIDGRQMRGKGESALPILTTGTHSTSYIPAAKPPGIIRAAAQYGVANRIMDLCTFDVTQNPWRCGELFDAIVTDPPCTFSIATVSLAAIANLSNQTACVPVQNVSVGKINDRPRKGLLLYMSSVREYLTRHSCVVSD